MGQTGVGYCSESWNRRERERAAKRDALFEAAFEREMADLSAEAEGEDTAVKETESKVTVSGTANPDALKERVIEAISAPNSFPVKNVEGLPVVADPLERLTALMEELREHGDYRRVRDEYCCLSILLNSQGAIAPAFRPLPKTGKRKGSHVFLEIHRDHVVIDCHWLYCKKLMVKARDVEFRSMFDTAHPFPFGLAWMYAKKNWKSTHRADQALGLTTYQQSQTVTMRGSIVAGRYHAALKGDRGRVHAKIGAVKQGLNEWCERDRRVIPHYEDYLNLWLARELLGADAAIHQIAELFSLMTGDKPRDDKTIRCKLEKMDRHIGGV